MFSRERMAKSPLPPPPPPMLGIREVRGVTNDLVRAAQRANEAWTEDQMIDALRSVRYWLERAERSLPGGHAEGDAGAHR